MITNVPFDLSFIVIEYTYLWMNLYARNRFWGVSMRCWLLLKSKLFSCILDKSNTKRRGRINKESKNIAICPMEITINSVQEVSEVGPGLWSIVRKHGERVFMSQLLLVISTFDCIPCSILAVATTSQRHFRTSSSRSVWLRQYSLLGTSNFFNYVHLNFYQTIVNKMINVLYILFHRKFWKATLHSIF